ncbi:cation transporter [Candidatus Saccharibacteria bacterium]|nr:MAG: cation transporter [Candidatus Saccharibacteria bacterium]
MSHSHDNNDGSIKFGLVLNTAFTIVEFVFGILTGSLALIADAAHNLTDTFYTICIFCSQPSSSA